MIKPNIVTNLLEEMKLVAGSACGAAAAIGKSSQKHRKIITKCAHKSEQYYANGMCKNCYHSKGRTKLASKCDHTNRSLYAKGVCKNCYLSIYHKKKRNT